MGWSYGKNLEGREIGYSVPASCDRPDCGREIDRGVGYACGGMHDADDISCAGYFCWDHLRFVMHPSEDRCVAVCDDCADALENDCP